MNERYGYELYIKRIMDRRNFSEIVKADRYEYESVRNVLELLSVYVRMNW